MMRALYSKCVVCHAPNTALNKSSRCTECRAAKRMTPREIASRERCKALGATSQDLPIVGRKESPYEHAVRAIVTETGVPREEFESALNHPLAKRVDTLARELAGVPEQNTLAMYDRKARKMAP